LSRSGKIALTVGVVCTVLVVTSWGLLTYVSSRATAEMEQDTARMLQQLDKLTETTADQPCGRCEADLALCRMMLATSDHRASVDAGPLVPDVGDAGAR
jgi:hypothetical protein